MRDLRLTGVHDDGEHLVVEDGDGQSYRLRIDEALRAAVRRDRPRLGQLQIEIDGDVRPRDVQALIRAGASAEEVAARTGWSPERVARFEGPVLAEREHVAAQAQTVRLRGATGSAGAETLAARARHRFIERGVELDDVRWDSARDAEGQWTVSASFVAGGRDRTATWWFDTVGMSVVAKNDEARWLSEADAPSGPIPAHVHRPTTVFDVEADQGAATGRTSRPGGSDVAVRSADHADLDTSMRRHSGARARRRGRRQVAHTEEPLPLVEDPAPGSDPGDGEGQQVGSPSTSEDGHTSATSSTAPSPVRRPESELDDQAGVETEFQTESEFGSEIDCGSVAPEDEPDGSQLGTGPEVDRDDIDPAAGADDSVEVTSGDEPTVEADPFDMIVEPYAAPEPSPTDTDPAPDTETDEAPASAEPGPSAAPSDAPGGAEAQGAGDESGTSRSDDATASSDDAGAQPESSASGEKTSAPSRRKGRARVPSWDDVMFGAKRP